MGFYKKHLKLFSGLLLPLVCGGAIASTATAVSSNRTVANNKTAAASDSTITPPITQKQYDDYVISVRDAIAGKMNSIESISNKHQNWIQTTVGTYLANVQAYDPVAELTEKADIASAPLTADQILQKKYDYAQSQAHLLGVDVIDYDDFINNRYDGMCQTFMSDDQGSPTYDQDVAHYKATLSQALSISKANYLDNFGFATVLSAINEKDGTTKDPNDPKQDYELGAAFAECRSLIAKLQLKEDTSDFTAAVSGYSATGHYKAGDEIQVADFQKMYNYTYDIAGYGVNYADFLPDNIDQWRATKPGDYDQKILDTLYITQNFSGCTAEDSPVVYQPGELIPGITLHAQIVTMDTSTDSHECKMHLKYGISHTSNLSKVLWYDINNEDKKLQDEDELTKVNDVSLKITSEDELRYMATNTYYANHAPYQITVAKNDKADGTTDSDIFSYRDDYTLLPDEQGHTATATVYGLEDWKERPYLDEMLDKYGTGNSSDLVYDFAKNPEFITSATTYFGNPKQDGKLMSDFYGIPLPDNSADFDFDAMNHMHQELAIKIGDIDTNDNIISINWCYMDAINDQAKTVDSTYAKNTQGYRDVCDIPWQINGAAPTPTINLYYHINPSTKGYIDNGLMIGSVCSSMLDTTTQFVSNLKHIDTGKVATYVNVNAGLDVLTQTLSIASAVISAVNAAQAVYNMVVGDIPGSAWLWVKAIAGSLVACLCLVTFGFQCKQTDDDRKMLSNMEKYTNTYNQTDLDTWTTINGQIASDYTLLSNPHGTYTAKKQAAADIDKAFVAFFSIDANKTILLNELRCNYNQHQKFDGETSQTNADQYAEYCYEQFMSPLGTDPSHQLTDDEIEQIVLKDLMLNDVDSNLTEQTTDYVVAITNRQQTYLDSGFSEWFNGPNNYPTMNWRMLTDWSNTKRWTSNAKNAGYCLRDMANLLGKWATHTWESRWDWSDLASGLLAKWCPIPGLRTVANFFSRFQDIAHKFVDAKKMYSGAMTMFKASKLSQQSYWKMGDVPFVAICRATLAALSTAAYLTQSIMTSAWKVV